mmetsp:Transcript_93753/g.242703  ORF Transcript_93753/g.242703 Transcript_93753/m.242703 type:complete len:513 (+) Transcript_93753:102-1640(+)
MVMRRDSAIAMAAKGATARRFCRGPSQRCSSKAHRSIAILAAVVAAAACVPSPTGFLGLARTSHTSVLPVPPRGRLILRAEAETAPAADVANSLADKPPKDKTRRRVRERAKRACDQMYKLLIAKTGNANISSEVVLNYYAREPRRDDADAGWLARFQMPFLEGCPEFVSPHASSIRVEAKRLAARAALEGLTSRSSKPRKQVASRKSRDTTLNATAGAPTNLTVVRKKLRKPRSQIASNRTLIAELEIGQKLQGRIVNVASKSVAGMMVDVGAERNAFLPWEECGPRFPRILPVGRSLSFTILSKYKLPNGNTTIYVTLRRGELARPKGYFETLNKPNFNVGKESVSEFVGISGETWLEAEVLRFYASGKDEKERSELKRPPGIMVRLTAPGGSTPVEEIVPFLRLSMEFKANISYPGSMIPLRVLAVNTTSRRVLLTMLPSDTSKLDQTSSKEEEQPAGQEDAGKEDKNQENGGDETREESAVSKEEAAPSTTTSAPPSEDNSLLDVLFR